MGSIRSGGPSLSLSIASKLVIDTGADTETFKMIHYSEDFRSPAAIKRILRGWNIAWGGALPTSSSHLVIIQFLYLDYLSSTIFATSTLTKRLTT